MDLEAEGINGIGKDGGSDIYVKLSVDGKKRDLETKRAEKTNSPLVRFSIRFRYPHAVFG